MTMRIDAKTRMTADSEFAKTNTRSNGEAGVGYLREVIADIRFDSLAELLTVASTILDRTPFASEPFPKFEINQRLGKRTRGRYYWRDHRVQLASTLSLATALHEIAHGINWTRHKLTGHNRHFKAIVATLYHTAIKYHDRPIPSAAAYERKGYRPRLFETVTTKGCKLDGLLLEVLKINPTRVRVRLVTRTVIGRTEKTFNVPFQLLRPIEGEEKARTERATPQPVSEPAQTKEHQMAKASRVMFSGERQRIEVPKARVEAHGAKSIYRRVKWDPDTKKPNRVGLAGFAGETWRVEEGPGNLFRLIRPVSKTAQAKATPKKAPAKKAPAKKTAKSTAKKTAKPSNKKESD